MYIKSGILFGGISIPQLLSLWHVYQVILVVAYHECQEINLFLCISHLSNEGVSYAFKSDSYCILCPKLLVENNYKWKT